MQAASAGSRSAAGSENASSPGSGFRPHLVPQDSDAFDLDFDHVSVLHRYLGLAEDADALGRPGEDRSPGSSVIDAVM